MDNLTIWIAVSKAGQVLLFSDEPTREYNSWTGTYYINSAVYENVLNLVSNANMVWENDAEPLILEVTKPI